MKQLTATSLLALLLCLGTQAQTVLKSNRELLLEDMNRAVHTMHRYEALDTTDTPAPKGYKPFYISHMGRHGSRFEDKLDFYNKNISSFERFDSLGVLTEDGKWLLNAMKVIRDTTDGHLGMLTSLGAAEHQDIARRMVQRFPEVWNQDKRNLVMTYSTSSVRVLDSRSYFTSSLLSYSPDLEVKKYQSGDEIGGVKVSRMVSGCGLSEEDTKKLEQLKKPTTYPQNPYPVSWRRLAEKTFTDPENHSDGEVSSLMSGAFFTISFGQCISETMPDVKEYFTPEEAYCFWYPGNYSRYNSPWVINKANRGIGAKKIIPVVRLWITAADEAINGGRVAADLRFSHDAFVQPVLSLFGTNGNEIITWPEEIGDGYCSFTSICMGTNIQMIFYKSEKSKDILVKLLHNEREVIIPSLKRTNGVYHRWKDVKKYLDKRIKALEYGTLCK